MTLTIGLTGGIASGKSTVSQMFKEAGIVVIDADVIARKVVEIGEEAYEQIVQSFGEDILLPDKTINRPKLGSIVFFSEDKRLLLNSIVHPAVRKQMLKEKEEHMMNGEETVVLDIPLLFESKLTSLVDKTLLVYVDYEKQLSRLMNRNSLTKEEAEARIQSQMPLKDKIQLADAVIDNNGTIEATKDQFRVICKQWGIQIKVS
ncbi:dephospho-CoA kinase [Fredinandcohnia sp. QZ13]|uniref:dephospho-CoA kinase n=1 Tax=Fredinandcohnia sp. QZ13 TaxID=3073144 RepID=UPI0028532F1F|nr:dephospho-CoA kinase [Fredinandcohnia sp. QZ13]MDR4889200.1 dephospho-CoA kinase [Fredinandcohnia sp. QZ13]